MQSLFNKFNYLLITIPSTYNLCMKHFGIAYDILSSVIVYYVLKEFQSKSSFCCVALHIKTLENLILSWKPLRIGLFTRKCLKQILSLCY